MRHLLFILAVACCGLLHAAGDFPEKARWITAAQGEVDAPNTWIAFRRDVQLDKLPREVVASIAADSKYWLWVNGRMVVFEGQLKRGPAPGEGYYDRVDLRPYLKRGTNQVALLLWYFGKSGFSHLSSGKSGLLFSAPEIGLVSDSRWMSRIHPAYSACGEPVPNWRLSESSIHFDARKDMADWQTAATDANGFVASSERGKAGDAPWNSLTERPIPLWKNYGVVKGKVQLLEGQETDTLAVHLPYNMQLTPVITVEDPTGGHTLGLYTDHLKGGSEYSVRAEYVTRAGRQTYESLGWMNAEWLYVTVPKGVKVSRVAYRQTGYDTQRQGGFHCDDDYFNRYWEKGMRTLYVNMRDSYFDCPERERAQWWGDATLLMGESFYGYDTRAHGIMRKGIRELCAHQKADNTLHSPIPGIYEDELPGQMLAAVGMKGFWNYFMNTADTATLAMAYPHVCRYLSLWKLEEGGLTAERHGAWDWGDWGDHRDIRLIYAAWHYIALDAAARMADVLGRPEEADSCRRQMARLKVGFNACWNGSAYRHPSYKEDTDDRVQALAVVSGLADKDKYPAISRLFHTTRHASPYMEKYVTDALFMMGEGAYGMERCRERYAYMVEHPDHTTLFEGWGIGQQDFGGGTTNHAWSGGPLITICQHLMGVYPTEAGWRQFSVDPKPVCFGQATLDVPTVRGMVHFSFERKDGQTDYRLTVPQGTEALVCLPRGTSSVVKGNLPTTSIQPMEDGRLAVRVTAGKYNYTIANE